jgi:hypothetical protein
VELRGLVHEGVKAYKGDGHDYATRGLECASMEDLGVVLLKQDRA